ncbi:MocR-like pyridoxine biosynthesis transcription factor PdxR [Asaia prunellae]|uniref:MocR-like pyridoxine biosynthesis transcription factor PdxR n=1 Tax=Asaia prunellae TaxID=610245 RepID=UPI00046F9EF4|nr:PLP-dependent aminotransferase family protein [Asaia prunellae]
MPVFLPAFWSPDPASNETLPVQLFHALGAAIRTGRVSDEAVLPSTRQAAAILGLSRSSISSAYDLLRAEGLVEMRPGSRPVVRLPAAPPVNRQGPVAPDLSERGRQMSLDARAPSYATNAGRLAPGLPDETEFPADLWAQMLRRQARHRYGDEAGYEGYCGARILRETLCTRLARDRGLDISPDQILITCGTQASLDLITRIMTDPGDSIAIEDPGYLGARAVFLANGVQIRSVPVDEEGMQAGAVPTDARLIYITPSNQYPLGGRMGLERRLALLDQARRQGALILEDDYDSEFLWHGREIAALTAHSSGAECVYLGSVSKTLLPGLRLGWMVVPEPLITPMRTAHRSTGCAANLHAQMALAKFMQSGHYRKHLRHISRLYQKRGNALFDALSTCPDLVVMRPRGGVQLSVRFRKPGHETRCQNVLANAGYRVVRLSALCLTARHEGLVIGFASLRPEDPARITTLLSDAIALD